MAAKRPASVGPSEPQAPESKKKKENFADKQPKKQSLLNWTNEAVELTRVLRHLVGGGWLSDNRPPFIVQLARGPKKYRDDNIDYRDAPVHDGVDVMRAEFTPHCGKIHARQDGLKTGSIIRITGYEIIRKRLGNGKWRYDLVVHAFDALQRQGKPVKRATLNHRLVIEGPTPIKAERIGKPACDHCTRTTIQLPARCYADALFRLHQPEKPYHFVYSILPGPYSNGVRPTVVPETRIEHDHETMSISCNGEHCQGFGAAGAEDGCILRQFDLPPIDLALKPYLEKRQAGTTRKLTSDFKRSALYAYFDSDIFASTAAGDDPRVRLPKCVVCAIRNAYPNARGKPYTK